MGMTRFAAELAGTGRTDPALTVEQLADVLWLAMDWHNDDWLVRRRGWSTVDFERWYVCTTAAAILVDQDRAAARGGTTSGSCCTASNP